MRQQYGNALCGQLLAALFDATPTSLRLNPHKASALSLTHLRSQSPVPWCPEAYYLPERPSFTCDPLFHAGAYYVQEASSMFLAQALLQYPQPIRVALDLCAAPGGKSTLLRSLLPEDALLVSNEPMPKRAHILAENMQKWGHPHTVVTQNYPAHFAPLANTFDLIVCDAPCSGEGMFRKDEDAIRDWSMDNVNLCWQRQRDIVRDSWPCLKPGGLFVYSTCTFNHYEDEDNVEWIAQTLGADILPLNTPAEWKIQGNYHFLPGQTRGEGFYLALLRKHGEMPESHEEMPEKHEGTVEAAIAAPRTNPKKKDLRKEAATSSPSKHTSYLLATGGDGGTLSIEECLQGNYQFVERKDQLWALPSQHATLITHLTHCLHTLVTGIQVAERKGKEWMPSHPLVISQAYAQEAFPRCELTYNEALAYLRHEGLRIHAPKGYVVVTYQHLPLGLVKNIGSRANNLYPNEWRIRTTYTTPYTVADAPTGTLS